MMVDLMAYGFGVMVGYYVAMKRPAPPMVTLKVMPPEPDDPLDIGPSDKCTEWRSVFAPIIVKLEVAAMFGSGVSFNAVGADAVAKMLKTATKNLDRAVELQLARRPGGKESR